MSTNYEDTERLIMSDLVARTAARENGIRRRLAASITKAMETVKITDSQLAERTECPMEQIQRLLHKDRGGVLELRTIVRAADVLGLSEALFEKNYQVVSKLRKKQ